MLIELLVVAALAPGAGNSAAREFAQASITARERLNAVRRSDTDPAVPVRAQLKTCIDDWAARPDGRALELRQFYDVAVTAPLWVRERPPMAEWVATLKRIRGIAAVRALRD